MTPPSQSETARFSIAAAIKLEFHAATNADAAWSTAKTLRAELANVLDRYGLEPDDIFLNVWDAGNG